MSSSSSVLSCNPAEEVGELLMLLISSFFMLLLSSSPLLQPSSFSPSPVEELEVMENGIGDCGLTLLVLFPLTMLV